MLFKLLALLLHATAAIAAYPHCTFTVQILETCRFNSTPTLSTRALLHGVTSPLGKQVVGFHARRGIEASPLVVYAAYPPESIVGDLAISRPRNEKVEFGWTYGPSGGRPVTEKWSEDVPGRDGRYGCRVASAWTEPEVECSAEKPTGARDEVLDCWFDC